MGDDDRRTRILLVDDHTIFRESLRLLLEQDNQFLVVGELSDATKIQENARGLLPHVIVMDISMPNTSGIEATRGIRQNFPKIKVVALSGHCHRPFVMEMLEAGATAYVVKSSAGRQLLHAIANAARGEVYLCPEATKALLEVNCRRGADGTTNGTVHDKKVRLGRREVDVLRLLTLGQSSSQIGKNLHIAACTVDVHRRNIMSKLDIHSVAELTKYAIRAGITSV